jgi:hypothetical protein
MDTPVSPPDLRAPPLSGGDAPSASLTARVLARLPAAEQQRMRLRRRQRLQRVAAVLAASGILVACLGFQGSDAATRTLAWLYAAAVAWNGLVSAAIGSIAVLPTASAACLLGVSVLLWGRFLDAGRRGLK